MEENNTTVGDKELIVALAAGASVREAAGKAGVSERTVYRRLVDADFRRALKGARDRLFDAGVGLLAGLTSTAAETLERLMESTKPSEALAAAKAVLEMGPWLRRATKLEDGICELEDDEPDEAREENLTPEDEELVRALAAGATTREAAEQAGIEEETAQTRLADAGFRRAVSRARGRLYHVAAGRLAGLASGAAGVFERLMQSDQPSVARRAAKTVLQLGPKLRETEWDERVTRLEEIMASKPKPKGVIIDNNPWYGESR